MDALLKNIESINYDLFGIFLPGLLGLVFFSVIVCVDAIVFDFNISNIKLQSLSYDVLKEDYLHESAFAIVLFSYFGGHILKTLGKQGVPIWGVVLSKWLKPKISPSLEWICFVLLIGEKRPARDFREAFSDAYELAAPKLAVRLGLDKDAFLNSWVRFYFFAKTFISQTGKHSLLANYQNKYTLHRSLAALAGVIFVMSAVTFMIAMCLATVGTGGRWILFAITVLSLALTWHFATSYSLYWTLFGDVVIGETTILLVEKNADDGKAEKSISN